MIASKTAQIFEHKSAVQDAVTFAVNTLLHDGESRSPTRRLSGRRTVTVLTVPARYRVAEVHAGAFIQTVSTDVNTTSRSSTEDAGRLLNMSAEPPAGKPVPAAYDQQTNIEVAANPSRITSGGMRRVMPACLFVRFAEHRGYMLPDVEVLGIVLVGWESGRLLTRTGSSSLTRR